MDTKNVVIRLAILWALLFSLNSLGTCTMVGLGNTPWAQISLQAKFVLCVGIFVNWSGTMMAYLSKAMHNLEIGRQLPTNGGGIPSLTKGEHPPQTGATMKTPLVIGLLSMALMWGTLIGLQGCSTANRTAYVAAAGGRVSVETGMGLYDQLVKSGKVSLADQAKVRDAYNKVRASMIAVADAGKIESAAAQTNGVSGLAAGADQLMSDFAQNKTDLFNLLSSLGVKF